MNIGVKGIPKQTEEFSEKVSSLATVLAFKISDLEDYDLVFDLSFDLDQSNWSLYAGQKKVPVVLGTAGIQLEALVHTSGIKPKGNIIGMNTLPTFINRSLAEVCSVNDAESEILQPLLEKLGFTCEWVGSRVGLVTPRVLLMIINEAFFTVQEGTATKEDIDLGMKLGTNYPTGPFEWCDKIGLEYVYKTLKAIYQDTHDERYKICPMLKTAYLRHPEAK